MLVIVINASAQRNPHFLTGMVSEKAVLELRLVQVSNNKQTVIGDYSITANNRQFAFALPEDTAHTYRLQINKMKLDGRHLKVDQSYAIQVLINPAQDNILILTPSKLNTANKTGWQLKKNTNRSSAAFMTGVVHTPYKRALQVNLQRVQDGEIVQSNSVQSNSDGSFELATPVIKEGFYYVSTVRTRVRVYLKPSDRVQVDIDHAS